MAEDKPFEATSQRLDRAKRDGDVPRSSDLNALASLGVAACAAFATAPIVARASSVALEHASTGDAARGPYLAIGACGLGVCISGLSGALFSTYLQSRRFTFKMPAPSLAKLNPAAGLKKLVSSDSAVSAAKASVVTLAIAATLAPGLRDAFASAVSASPQELAAQVWRSLQNAFGSAIAVAAFFAVVDVLLERRKWKKRLRMTFDELKREMKQNEGDPHLKGKRRQTQRAMVRGSIARIADAAFVVTNPTHIAVALEYAPPAIAVPRVLLHAVDDVAREIKRRARALDIPVIENVALARALFATTGAGEYIPPSAYAPVAAIVATLAAQKAIDR